MKRSTLLFIAAGSLAGWVGAAPAPAQGTTGGAASNTQGAPAAGKAQELITASATVEKVDADKRELTLKAENNKPFTITVPEGMTRLDQVKPGDKLHVSFYESVAVSLLKPGEAQPGQEKTTAAGRAAGNLPGGVVAQQITTTAKITQINPSKDELTIDVPGGKATTIKVDDPQVRSQLNRLKVGDKIQTTFTQAMATSVTPAKSM